jgi:hypothetical protein
MSRIRVRPFPAALIDKPLATTRSLSLESAARSDRQRRSLLSLECKVRTANDASQLRLLGGNLNRGASSAGNFHSFRELEPDSPLLAVINAVHDIDRETTRVEHVCHSNVLDLEGCRFERTRRDDTLALLLEDTFHPSDCDLSLGGWLYLVLKVAGLVRPYTGQRSRQR